MLDSHDKLATGLSSPWGTLAFPENVRTGDDMLKELLAVDTSGLNTFGKRSLYGTICALAKRLEREDVVAQYKNGLLALPQE